MLSHYASQIDLTTIDQSEEIEAGVFRTMTGAGSLDSNMAKPTETQLLKEAVLHVRAFGGYGLDAIHEYRRAYTFAREKAQNYFNSMVEGVPKEDKDSEFTDNALINEIWRIFDSEYMYHLYDYIDQKHGVK